MAKQREFGLDLVRAAAVTLVLSVHFFMNTDFYSAPLQSVGTAVASFVRMACTTCVPMFMVLTGWLCIDRRWSPGYYRKLLPILLTYALAGCLCMAFSVFGQGAGISPLGAVRRLLDFSAAPYGWYIEMYIGLFMLSPFINAAWKGLDDRGRLALVITMLVVTAVPTVVNMKWKIMPSWWTGIYPLTYDVLGAWLREHPIRARGWVLILGWLGLAAVTGGFTFAVRQGDVFIYAAWNNWGSLLVVGETVCLFSLLVRCKGTGVPAPVRWCVCKLSQLSLPLYMLSYITDQLFYRPMKAAIPDIMSRFPWMPVIVPAGLVCAGVMAQAVDWAVKALMRLVPKIEE